MFAATDPSSSPTVPGTPYLTVGRDGGVAKLTWSEGDTGGSAVTNYTVFRGTASGSLAFLASTGTTPSFTDNTATAGTTFFYRVTATNTVGTSCGSNEVRAVSLGESQCVGITEAIDPAGDQKAAPANADL